LALLLLFPSPLVGETLGSVLNMVISVGALALLLTAVVRQHRTKK